MLFQHLDVVIVIALAFGRSEREPRFTRQKRVVSRGSGVATLETTYLVLVYIEELELKLRHTLSQFSPCLSFD